MVLYERNNGTDNVTNKMVFKGNIESITDNELRIRLRAAQQNPLVFPENSRYAVEHDTMDTTFRSIYLGLSSFMDANPERRELLLGQRPTRHKCNTLHEVNVGSRNPDKWHCEAMTERFSSG